MLYFKLCDFKTAEKYLLMLCNVNKYARKFIKQFTLHSKEYFYKIMREVDPYEYQMNSESELCIIIDSSPNLYCRMPAYFDWAYSITKSKPTK